MSVDANAFEKTDENTTSALIEQKLETIIANARDIAIVSEELLRELMSPAALLENDVNRAQAISMSPMILKSVQSQIQALLTALQSK